MQVEQIDRELFIDILNPDSSTAESVRQGRSYTWEVEQLARHRRQARAEVVGEIVAWLRSCHESKIAHHTEVCHREDDEILDAIITAANTFNYSADQIEAKFGGRDAD